MSGRGPSDAPMTRGGWRRGWSGARRPRAGWRPRARGRWVAGLALAVVALATVAVVRAAPGLSLVDGRAAVEVAAAALPVAAALLAWRPRFAALLTLAAAGWLAAEWSSPGAGVLFTVGLVLGAAWPPVLGAAALRGLDERPLPALDRVVIGAGMLVTVGVLGIASAVVLDPRAQGCSACPDNLVLIAGSPSAGRALGHAGLALAIAFSAGFCVLAAARLSGMAGVRRRLAAPVLIPAAAAVAAFGADAAHGLGRGFTSTDPTDRALRLVQAAALALLGAGILLERLQARATRRRIAELVLDIGAAPAPGRLRARLADTLGDPHLELLHAVDGGWIDQGGRATEPASTATLVRAGGRDVMAVLHRPGLLDDPHLVVELAVTARLAVEHDRLQAAHRSRLEELRRSRERIVATADRERRALERDLHDGAQQRLVTLGLSIRLARRAAATTADAPLAAAEEHVRAAVVELREVAHGLFPSVLGDEGLAVALDVLSEHDPRLVVGSLPDGRFPPAVESAAYFAAVEALRLTPGAVIVDGTTDDGQLRLTIRADAAADLTRIADRAGAAGGTVTSTLGGLRLELPCGS